MLVHVVDVHLCRDIIVSFIFLEVGVFVLAREQEDLRSERNEIPHG
jgi:hypothetical protein